MASFFFKTQVSGDSGPTYTHPLHGRVKSGGLVYVREWNNMQYASSAAFLLAVYSDYLSNAHAMLKCPDAQVQPQDLLHFAKSQALTLYSLSFSL